MTDIVSQNSKIGIRPATDADLLSVTAILNREILESPYVWMETPVTLGSRREWLASHAAAGFPVIVAESETGAVLGWASLSVYRPSSGYRFTAESSVYVAREEHGRGVGRRLLSSLHDEARSRGVHAIVASIDAENAASIGLFERFGYVEVARLPEAGRKFDAWRTQLLLYHRNVAEHLR
jgi:L-amino acid N-acyltransferase